MKNINQVKAVLAKINSLPNPDNTTVSAFAHDGEIDIRSDESIEAAIKNGSLRMCLDVTYPHTRSIEQENARFEAFSEAVRLVEAMPEVESVTDDGSIDGDGYSGRAFLVRLRDSAKA